MIRLLLLLLGANVIRRRWRTLMGMGAFWFALGLFIFVDALDNVTIFPIRSLGYLLIMEGDFALLAALFGLPGLPRRTRVIEGVLLILAGLLTIEAPWHSDVALAVLLGVMFALDGAMKIATARVIRFPGWRSTQNEGFLSLVLAVLTLQPLPSWYVGTIGCNVGIALMLSGWHVVRLARRVRALEPDAPIASLLTLGAVRAPALPPDDGRVETGELIVRVWTPTGGAAARRPVIDRYIAAVDATGTISTGHSALEAGPDVYISHYPAAEIDRSPGQFGRVLRATPDNDVPGRFLPSYAEEAAGWVEANAAVRFRDFDARRLRAFWARYRLDPTYNLTSRNCSSVVAHALDAALEGQLTRQQPGWPALARVVANPQLWLASMLRKRAETMAWTPGLVLDYADALAAVLRPPEVGWFVSVRMALHRRRAAWRGVG